MGIKGTVRRATDGHIIHANVDTDVVVSEEPPFGSTRKPEELYQLIERFALGERCWCLVFWLCLLEIVTTGSICWVLAPGITSRTLPAEPCQAGEASAVCLFTYMRAALRRSRNASSQILPAGRRRLELFGEDHNIRPGWVTVGSALTSSNFNAAVSMLLAYLLCIFEACVLPSSYSSSSSKLVAFI